jgi:hypothetical protein
MKAQKKLAAGIAVAIIAVLIASQSVSHSLATEKVKFDRIKIRQNENVEKAKLKMKQEVIRDLSTGSENTR